MNKVECFAALLIVGLLCACSEKEKTVEAASPASLLTSQPIATASAQPESNTSVSANGEGELVFKKTCALCHQSGIGGAPIPGNKGDWTARIAQGEDVLFKHAIEGFNGEKGAMPAKGANPALSDDDIKSAVRYMINK